MRKEPIEMSVSTAEAIVRTKASVPQSLINKVLLTSVAGTTLEWYDFFIYGYLAAIIGKNFFPPGDPMAQMLGALLGFAVGGFFRPLGAIVFGYIGDRLGRKAAFMSSILLMALSTFCIGILPTYASIGVLATVLVFLLRACQGLSVGGAWGGAVTFVAEYVPPEKRGYYGSWIPGASAIAVVLANLVIVLCQLSLGRSAMEIWGWRIPFWLSLVLVFIALYLRSKLEETPVFSDMKGGGRITRALFKETVLECGGKLLVGMAITLGVTTSYYFAYFSTAVTLQTIAKVPFVTTAVIMMIAGFISLWSYVLLGGVAVDKWGRRPLVLLGLLLATLGGYPLFALLQPGNSVFVMALAPILLTFFSGIYYGPYGAWLPEFYPARVRYTALSLTYHIPIGIFGYLTPYITTFFVNKFHSPVAGAWYPVSACVVSLLVGLIFMRETRKVDIYQ